MSLDSEVAILTGEYRRMISLACVKAQAECLLNRLNQVGAGMEAANKRRKQIAWEEDQMRRQISAQQVAWVQGRRGLARKGHFLRD